MTFDEWWDRPEGCGHTPDTYKGWEASCHASWNAGQEQLRKVLVAANLVIERLQKDTEEVQAARIYLREQERMLKQLAGMREELAARDLMIERMREAIDGMFGPTTTLREDRWDKLDAARCLQPSTEALRDRDRKRDAALLRSVKDGWIHDDFLENLAEARESGEWEPNLEVK